jgi:ABC-2 type transport system permease protein
MRLPRHSLALCALIFAVWFPLAIAAQTQILRGIVRDNATNKPLSGARILLLETRRGALSGKDGSFVLQSTSDAQTLRVSLLGYETLENRIESSSQDTITLDIRLKLGAVRLGTARVETERLAAENMPTQNVTTVSGQELERSRGQTLGESLQNVAGITLLQTGASIAKPVIRGLHSQRVIVVNAGVQQEGQQWGAEHAPEIDPFAAQRIEVVRGAAGVEYGAGAIGGVIRVEPRHIPHGDWFGGEAQMALFSNNSQGALSLALEGGKIDIGEKNTLLNSLGNGFGWRVQGSARKAGDSRAPNYVIGNTGFQEINGSAAFGYTGEKLSIEAYYSLFTTELGIFRGSHIGNLNDVLRAIEAGRPHTGNSHQNVQAPFTFGGNKGARYATLAPQELALVAFGQSDLLPYYYRVTMTKKQSLYHTEEIENAATLYNGNFDVAFVILYCLPLLIIALTYNVVSSEREQGTLAMIFTENVGLKRLVWHKFLFRFVLLVAVFTVLLLVGLLLAKVNLLNTAPSLVLLLLATMLYAAFWFALSFAVNSFGRNSGFNAAILVGAWLLLVLIIPATLSVIATTLHPTPSRVELITQARDVSDAAKKRSSQILSKFYEDHPELLPKDKQVNMKDFATVALTAQMEVDKSIKPLQDRFDTQLQAQQTLVRSYRFLSPAVFMQHLLGDIAGTGYDRYAEFNAQVGKFYHDFQQFFVGKVFRQELMQSRDVAQIPAFRPQASAPSVWTEQHLLNIVLLLALTAAFVAVGFRRVGQITPVLAVA